MCLTHQGEHTRRVTHAIDIDKIFMLPVLPKGYGVGETMVFSHAVAPAWILHTTDGFRDCDVHHVLVKLPDRYPSGNEIVRSWRIRKDYGLIHVRRVGAHFDESTGQGQVVNRTYR